MINSASVCHTANTGGDGAGIYAARLPYSRFLSGYCIIIMIFFFLRKRSIRFVEKKFYGCMITQNDYTLLVSSLDFS